MPISDDEEFERYLKRFRPLAAQPLPLPRAGGAPGRWWAFAIPVAAVLAAVAWVVVVHLRPRPAPSPGAEKIVAHQQVTNAPPLTLGRTNHLLTHAESFKAALDSVAFQRQRSPLAKGNQSALATLGKEDFEL